MFRHLLVPLDGSPMAESVLSATADLVRRLSAHVTLLHVLERGAPKTVHGERHLTQPAEAESYLRGVAEWFDSEGVAADFLVHRDGADVAKSIADGAAEIGADLVVLWTPGWSGLRGFLLRLVAQPWVGPPVGPVPGERGAGMKLMPSAAAALLDAEAAQAATYLERVGARLREEGVKISMEVGRGEPIRVLLDTVAKQEIDLIVIATHGRSGIGAVWAGSVTSRILRYSTRPILLIRIPGPPPRSGC